VVPPVFRIGARPAAAGKVVDRRESVLLGGGSVRRHAT
jgi:hypothetical protein